MIDQNSNQSYILKSSHSKLINDEIDINLWMRGLLKMANQFQVISMRQIKMNNTKNSRLSIKTLKPSNFRVFLKQRSNHHEIQQSPTQIPMQNQTTKDTVPSKMSLKTDHLAKMKEYVRTRIKTQANQAPQSGLQSKATLIKTDEKFRPTAIDTVYTPSQPFKATESLSNFKIQLSNSELKLQNVSKPGLLTLKQLQAKAESLLMQKLSHCSAYKNQSSQQLQIQLKQLVMDIRSVEDSNPENSSKAIALINTKINLLEKIMAENMAQADIMKKHLLSKITNKAKIRRLKTEEYSKSNSPFMSYRDTDGCREVVVNTSMNQESYHSPERPAYNIYKHQQQRFNADRDKQPLPRSSYNREFLIYDTVKDSQILPVGNAIMGRSSSASMFRSSYRESFGPKQTSRINIRQLDACKDKIKNYPIDFSRRKSTSSGFIHYDICRNMPKARKYDQIPKVRASGRYLMSESRREFSKEAYNSSQSAIKHQNLQKMHYQYKKMLHA